MSDEDDTPEDSFFTRRAAFVPRITPEEFQSVAESLNICKNDSEIEVIHPPVKRVKIGATKKNSSAPKKFSSSPEVVDDSEIDIYCSPKLSAAAIRRLKKLQREQASELEKIEAENQQVLTAAETISDSDEEVFPQTPEQDAKMILTVSYMSELMRLRCLQHEKFSAIFPRVADLFKLKASEILLCLREQNIKVDDTPKSLNITLADTLECIPYKAVENSEINDVDKLKLIFQSNDSKEKIELFVHKLENMQEVMERYSTHRNIPLERLVFEFDGEKIEGSENPEDLDMESGNCIDVKVSDANPTKKKGRPLNGQTKKEQAVVSVIDITDESETSEDRNMVSGTSADVEVSAAGPSKKKRGRPRKSRRGRKK